MSRQGSGYAKQKENVDRKTQEISITAPTGSGEDVISGAEVVSATSTASDSTIPTELETTQS